MSRHRLPAILLLITYLPACHTWRAETVTPQAFIETRPAIPLSDVQTVERLHRDVGKSFLLAGGITAGFLLFGAAVCSNSCGGLQN